MPGESKEQAVHNIVFLFDPKPRSVSLVKRGANKTPFRVVKHCKEDSMKVLQSIVALSATDAEAIKSVFAPEVHAALQLSAPKQSGKFTLYEQGPREKFKADTLEIVALKEDNSLLGIQGELIEDDPGLIVRAANMFKAQKTQKYIGGAGEAPVDAEVLKSALGNEMWSEISALRDSISGILEQREGGGADKVEMVRKIMNNFLAALELSVSTLKCDRFDFSSFREKEKQLAAASVEKKANPDVPKDASGEVPKAAAANSAAKDENAPSEVAKADVEEMLKAAVELANGTAEKSVSAVKKTLDEFSESLKSIQEEIAKMQKTPASVVRSHDDSGEPVLKRQKDGNVFAGVFGNIRR
jgi:hypothetical protein